MKKLTHSYTTRHCINRRVVTPVINTSGQKSRGAKRALVESRVARVDAPRIFSRRLSNSFDVGSRNVEITIVANIPAVIRARPVRHVHASEKKHLSNVCPQIAAGLAVI